MSVVLRGQSNITEIMMKMVIYWQFLIHQEEEDSEVVEVEETHFVIMLWTMMRDAAAAVAVNATAIAVTIAKILLSAASLSSPLNSYYSLYFY